MKSSLMKYLALSIVAALLLIPANSEAQDHTIEYNSLTDEYVVKDKYGETEMTIERNDLTDQVVYRDKYGEIEGTADYNDLTDQTTYRDEYGELE
jgi:hypothetical protein